jgi:hypothetical protein
VLEKKSRVDILGVPIAAGIILLLDACRALCLLKIMLKVSDFNGTVSAGRNSTAFPGCRYHAIVFSGRQVGHPRILRGKGSSI